jgi:hypothetical protein
MQMSKMLPSLALLACLASCRPAEERQAPSSPGNTVQPVTPAAYVDSTLSRDEELRRFRADLRAEPVALSGGFTSREALVRELVHVLERSDTLALEPLVITRAEFAFLYYPSAPLSRPPYELSPSLMWLQIQESNRSAALALLRQRGGTPLGFVGHECAHSERQGANLIWSACSLTRRMPDGSDRRERLFGSVIERDGRYKFVALSNELH